MKLVIVESPGKISKISSYLGEKILEKLIFPNRLFYI